MAIIVFNEFCQMRTSQMLSALSSMLLLILVSIHQTHTRTGTTAAVKVVTVTRPVNHWLGDIDLSKKDNSHHLSCIRPIKNRFDVLLPLPNHQLCLFMKDLGFRNRKGHVRDSPANESTWSHGSRKWR
jgi:hypothetical protein